MFAWAEPGLRIDDPVRSLLRSAALVAPHDCASTRVFAIRHEMRIGNAYSTKSTFEDAVASEACRGNVGLWVAYVRFCYRQKELRARAKDVFYRAVHACPWSKALVMEGFTTIIKDLESNELTAVYDSMLTKGLCVHVEMQDFVQKWQETSKSR